jgi:hypothetical protein
MQFSRLSRGGGFALPKHFRLRQDCRSAPGTPPQAQAGTSLFGFDFFSEVCVQNAGMLLDLLSCEGQDFLELKRVGRLGMVSMPNMIGRDGLLGKVYRFAQPTNFAQGDTEVGVMLNEMKHLLLVLCDDLEEATAGPSLRSGRH